MKTKVQVHRALLAAAATALLALAAVLPARADYSNTVMSLGPVAYWRLNEPAFPAPVYPPARRRISAASGSSPTALTATTPSCSNRAP